MARIIALVGRKGSGKSTLAKAIIALDPTFRVCSLAFPLKTLAVRLFQLDPVAAFGASAQREEKVKGSEDTAYWQATRDRAWALRYELASMFPRLGGADVVVALANALDTLQAEAQVLGGVTVRRTLEVLGTDWGRTLDSDVWVRAFLAQLGESDHVVVDDARFLNEVQAVQAQGGRAWFLDAGDRLPPLASDAHPSEPRLEAFPPGSLDGFLAVAGKGATRDPERVAAVLRSVNPR